MVRYEWCKVAYIKGGDMLEHIYWDDTVVHYCFTIPLKGGVFSKQISSYSTVKDGHVQGFA